MVLIIWRPNKLIQNDILSGDYNDLFFLLFYCLFVFIRISLYNFLYFNHFLELLFTSNLFLFVRLFHCLVVFWFKCCITVDNRIEVTHKKLDDILLNVLGVCNIQFLVIILQTNCFKGFHDTLGHFIDVLREFLEHGRMKEKPDTMWEEKVGLGSQNHHIEKTSGVFMVSFKIEGAKLWNIKL